MPRRWPPWLSAAPARRMLSGIAHVDFRGS